jgi:hypothetical protein
LRRWTRLRRACVLLDDALAEAEHVHASTDQSAAEARSRKHTWIAHFEERHSQLLEVGTGVLSREIEEELNSFFTRRSSNNDELRAKIETVCNGWLANQLTALAKLAQDSDARLPSLNAVSIKVAPMAKDERPSKQKAPVETTLQKALASPLGKLAEELVGLIHHFKLDGKTTQDIQKEIDKENKKKSPDTQALAALELIVRESKLLDRHEKMAPKITEAIFASIDLISESDRRRADAETSAQEVAERQKVLSQCASRAAAMAVGSIVPHFDAYRQWLDEEAARCDEVISSASDELALIASRIETLRNLIENASVPRS